MEATERLRSLLSDRYQIEREIGAGGMATVYLARDLRHNRRVALKVLRPELAAVLGPERFLAEINVTANLQHPHLLPLFDSGEADGLLYYVMPFVEGESLRERLNRERQLPIDDAIRITTAVASALDYAHRHNVVHRDLKPENILLHEGQPLIADFGIALAVSNAGGARVTQTGLSLGTPQYMSPEQATGDRAIDARSDIYSLAAVLYELLTGEPPHIGTTVQAIIARVLTDAPKSVRIMRPKVPEHVDAAMQQALAKLPADRFSTAGAFAEALRRGVQGSLAVAPIAGRAAARARTVRLLTWAPLVIGLVLAGSAVLLRERGAPSSGWPFRFQIVLDSIDTVGLGGTAVALSADGSQLAFVGMKGNTEGIFVRRVDEFDSRLVRGAEGGLSPVFSPDGKWIAFFHNGILKKVPASGGPATTLTDTAGSTLHWAADDQVFFSRDGDIWRVSAAGGRRVLVATPDSTRGHTFYAFPHVLPDGKSALVTLWKTSIEAATGELGVLELATGRVTELGVPGVNPRYLHTGHILFGRADGTVFAAPFSLRRRRLTAEPLPVIEGVSIRTAGSVDAAVSSNGTLVYRSSGDDVARLVRVDRNGQSTPLIEDLHAYHTPRVSPDGRRLALTVFQPRRDIWTLDIASRTLSRLTTMGTAWDPEWSRDGQRIAYTNHTAKARIDWQPWDGSTAAAPLIEHDVPVWEASFGRSGRYTVIREDRVGGVRDILFAPADSLHALRPLLATPANERMPQVSPDGALLAYVSDESGRNEVYVRALPGPGGRVQISTEGALEPVWSPGGRELFYRTQTHVMSAVIDRAPELSVQRRVRLFADQYLRNGNHVSYDVFPNGSDFVFVQPLRTGAPLLAVVNWTDELRRKMVR